METCFPSAVKVNLKNGKTVRMTELQIGDQIKSGEQRIKNFLHRMS